MPKTAAKLAPTPQRDFVLNDAAPICFTLPLPQSVNNWWRPVVVRTRTTHAKMVLTDNAIQFKHDAYAMLLIQRGRTGARPIYGPVACEITVYENRAGRDGDNYGKAIFDALKGFAYHDDKQVRWHSVELIAPPQGRTKAQLEARAKWKARVEVKVSPLKPGAEPATGAGRKAMR